MEKKANCTIRYEYDRLNRITKAIMNQSVVLTYEYDAAGNITLIKKALQHSIEDDVKANSIGR